MIPAYRFCEDHNLSFWKLRKMFKRKELVEDEDCEIKINLHSKSILLKESGQRKVMEKCQKYSPGRAMTF